MQLVVDDLLCPSCAGYVHPFLDACPACGAVHLSRYGEAVAGGAIGAAALVVDEATRRAAHAVVRLHTLRSSPDAALVELDAGFGIVAGSLTYRATVAADGPTPVLPAGATTADTAEALLAAGSLAIRARPAGRSIATIPLASIVAATPIVKGSPAPGAWAGVSLGGRRLLERRVVAAGDLLVTFADTGGAGQLGLANRRGLLAPRARPDHYVTLARWLAILAAAAAEERWRSVGPAAYLAQLGLGAQPEPAAVGVEGAAPGIGAPPHAVDPAAGAAAGVRSALEALEELRTAGLVRDDEYAAKRTEILARL